MGRDLGRAAPSRRPARTVGDRTVAWLVAPAAALVAACVVGAAPASAADPTPSPTPMATPSVSPPSQRQIEDARNALAKLRNPAPTTPTAVTRVVGPAAAEPRPSVTSRISDQAWWTMAAGLLVLLVASETTRLSVRRAKHRRDA